METYHGMEGNDLVAKTLKEKWVSGEAQKIIGNTVDLAEIWDTVDTCYQDRRSIWRRLLSL